MNCPKCKAKMKLFRIVDLSMLIGRLDRYYNCAGDCKGKDGLRLCCVKSLEANV